MAVLIWPSVETADDEVLRRIADKFEPYCRQHGHAKIHVQSRNPVTIWIRVIDPDFAGVDRADRHEILWKFIESLDENDLNQISLLLALTPQEAEKSPGSLSFEHPAVAYL